MKIGMYCNWSVKKGIDGFYIASIHKDYLDEIRKFSSAPLTLVSNVSLDKPHPTEAFVSQNDVILRALPPFKNYLGSVTSFFKIAANLKWLSRNSDFIYIKTFEPFSWLMPLLKAPGCVLNYHIVANPFESIWMNHRASLFSKILKSTLFFPEYLLICISAFTQQVSANGSSVLKHVPFFLRQKIRVLIESSLKPSDFKSEKAAKYMPMRLLTVAALKNEKGHLYLFKALKEFRTRFPDVPISLSVVGDGEDAVDIKNQASSLGITDITTFHGHLNGENLRREYDEANIFVLTSLSETGPRVLLEALAAKLFVICSDVGYVREVLQAAGYITRVGDGAEDDVTQALSYYLANKEDVQRKIIDGFETSKKFTLASFVKELLN